MPTVTKREAARRDLIGHFVRVLHAASDWWNLLGFED
jgi:hypothetical protein